MHLTGRISGLSILVYKHIHTLKRPTLRMTTCMTPANAFSASGIILILPSSSTIRIILPTPSVSRPCPHAMASTASPMCRVCGLPLPRRTSYSHACPFCDRTFRRVDATKRHTKTCPSRGDRLLRPDAKRGRRLRACDVCSRVKVSCDAKTPCTRCVSRGFVCSYSRLCTNPAHTSQSECEPKLKEPVALPDKEPVSLPFLLACTNTSIASMDEIIVTSEIKSASKPLPTGASPDCFYHLTSATIDPRFLFSSFLNPSLVSDLQADDPASPDCCIDLHELDLDISNEELQGRISVLESRLRLLAASEPRFAGVMNTDSATAFFNLSGFQECIKAFFEEEQLLATLIHKPTFHATQVDITLLLGIAVSGSTYLHYRRTSTEFIAFIRNLRELTEKYIFSCVDRAIETPGRVEKSQQMLELCQAAYIIATLQSCVKDPGTRQRIITKHHPMLVALLRRLDILESRHNVLISGREWHMFVYTESCIRLSHWVFINDAWLSMFSNHPPTMTILEMTCHLPCEDRFWESKNYEAFVDQNFQQVFKPSIPCLKSLVSGLMGNEWTESLSGVYQGLHIRHYLILIFCELYKKLPSSSH